MKTRICLLFIGAILLISSLAFSQQTNKAENLYQEALMQMEGRGNYTKALEIFGQVIKDFPGSRQTCARSQFQIGVCNEKLGNAEARKAYERVVRDYADQAEIVAQARVRLAALGGSVSAGGLVTRRVLADASGVSGVLTPDGKYISHIDWETGDIIQFEVANAQTRRITNRGGTAAKETPYQYQAFSRDGKQIAYDSYTKEYVPQLRIRNLDGSGLRTLYSEKGYDAHPLDWSPNAGSILALRERNKAVELTLISTADGSVRVLRSIASVWVSARFSPDGRSIAFSFVSEGSSPQGDIYLMTADGRNEVVVAGHPADDQLLGWTPDGRSLLFFSDRLGTWDIWTVPITGGKQQGEPELLKKNFGWDSEVLGFAPDGSCYYKTVTYLGHLYIGALDLETGKVLVPPEPVTTRYTGPTNFLTWSPDGRNLAYLSHPGRIGPGNNILTIRSTATGEEHFLLPRLRGVNQISWAPDGRSIIALGITATGAGIFRIDTGTSAITKLADEGVFPRLCPDGKTLVSVSVKGIIKRNLETGEESEVVKAGMHYALSPDGREVVFQVDGVVKTVSLNGGEPRELFRGLAQYYGLGWTRDGRYIIARAFGSGSGETWRVPARGGTPLKLDLSDPKMMAFAFYPDNHRCAYSVNEGSKSELWVMENFLPKEKSEASNQKSAKLLLSGTGSGGKLSPDETRVVYRGGEGNLLVKDLKTGMVKTVVKFGERDGDYAVNLVWSPDGKQIVYTYGAPMLVHDLRIGNTASGESRIIYSDALTYPFAQDWSADGKSVVCMLRKSNGTFAGYGVFNLETRKLSQFVSAEGGESGEASFSPDGKYILYDLMEKGNRDLFTYSVVTGEKTRLTDSPAEDGKASWSRDGKYVVFSSNRRGTWDLWGVPIQNAKTAGEPFLVQPDFGNKSKKITRSGKLVYNVSISMNDVYTLDVNPMTGESTGDPKLITTSHLGKHNAPEWSPDGKKIAYMRNSNLLCVRTLEDGREECIETGMEWIAWISWSPDGKSVALSGQAKSGKIGVYLYSYKTGQMSTIIEGEPPGPILAEGWSLYGHRGWSLNGKEFICERLVTKDEQKRFVDRELVARELVAIDVNTNEKRILERSVNTGWSDRNMMQLSPDRKRMAYVQIDSIRKEVRLVVSDLKDQEKRALVTMDIEKAWFLYPIWSPDGRMIEYHLVDRTSKQNNGEVRVIAVDGSWEKKIKTGKLAIVTGMSQDAWSPDGRKLAVTLSGEPTKELWAMENFLPKEVPEIK